MLGFGFLSPGREKKNAGPEDSSRRENTEEPDFIYMTRSSSLDDVAYEGDLTPDEKLNISVYDRYNRGVVNITTQVIGYNWFLEPVPAEGASGSGSIIDIRGYILTNNHVVENAYKVYITLADGTQFEGEVIGTDPENDLSVIQFDPAGKDLVTIPFGNSGNLRIGQKVLAIGNPYGLERTLTVGVVSGLGRPLKNRAGLVMDNMIQTDASINPGNSGGPLLNSKGEMIGINTMIYSPSGGSVGIGFAVPVDTAKEIVPDLIKYGKVLRGWIDIVPVQLFPSLARYAGLSVSEGILVSRVIPGGNAESAGLQGGQRSRAVRSGNSVIYLGGDIIVEIDGKPVTSLASYYGALKNTRPGDSISVTILRDRKKMTLDVTLSERPDQYIWE
jgi:S1-C subfamily serine protease